MGEKLLLRCREIPELRRLEVYRAHGGYEAARKALTQHTPEALVDMVIDIHMTQRQKRAGAPRRCVAGAGERRLGQAKAPLVAI